MLDRDLTAQLLPTPFVSSFVGRARPGLELTDPDPSRRSGAWASWAIGSFAEFRGLQDRAYVALVLPGRFHDPKGNGPQVRPHLEVPQWVFDHTDGHFPDRLAQMGNGLLFPWWLVTEVTALRRALFKGPRGDLSALLGHLEQRRVGLINALRDLSRTASSNWQLFEELLLASGEEMSALVTAEFGPAEIAALFPPARELGLRVVFDDKLKEKNGSRAARRVGVWQLRTGGDAAYLGVVTPRLTSNSLFVDPLFAPESESAASLLVRSLVLSRLLRRHLGVAAPSPAAASPHVGNGAPFLRAVPARVGARLPEASMASAVNWLQTYERPDAAWDALSRWAEAGGYLLTVVRDGFAASYDNAQKFLRRAEEPEREDINVVLPLAWDTDGKVVRVTFSRPADSD